MLTLSSLSIGTGRTSSHHFQYTRNHCFHPSDYDRRIWNATNDYLLSLSHAIFLLYSSSFNCNLWMSAFFLMHWCVLGLPSWGAEMPEVSLSSNLRGLLMARYVVFLSLPIKKKEERRYYYYYLRIRTQGLACDHCTCNAFSFSFGG